MEVLDRVLDGEDVHALLAVDLVDDRRERRALAGAGRSRDEHETVRLVRDVGDDRREAELVVREDLEGDGPDGGGDGSALEVDVPAKTRQVLHAEGEIELAVLLERDLLFLGHDRVAEVLRVDRGERRQLQRNDLTIDPQERRRSCGNVHVAGAFLHHRLEELVEVDSDIGGLRHRSGDRIAADGSQRSRTSRRRLPVGVGACHPRPSSLNARRRGRTAAPCAPGS